MAERICSFDGLDLRDEQLDILNAVRDFVDSEIIPVAHDLEASDSYPEEIVQGLREMGLFGMRIPEEYGGLGLDLTTYALAIAELSRGWMSVAGIVNGVYIVSGMIAGHGTEEQKERYLPKIAAGEHRCCFMMTEPEAGSDVRAIRTTARRDGDGWVLDGEKWHVTSGDVADFFLIHAHVDGDPSKPTVFLVDKGLPGVRLVRTPKYTHTFVFEHPIFAFEGVRLAADAVLGDVGQGYDLTKDWFVEERLMIGARTMGASARALELSLAFAEGREQFGRPIVGFQAIEFMLADMAAEIMAATSMLYRVCWTAARGGIDRKGLHAQASAVKLVCSETAGRVIDRAVQIHGGRGYMREQPVERLWRELRVDRIWEGTSEIQRVVIGNELRKRGPGTYTGWPTEG